MKKLIVVLFMGLCYPLAAQTLFVPSATSGIGTSTVAGKVGIGVPAPNANLQVGTGTENGLINVGGYSFIGNLRSGGDFFSGFNTYSLYSSSTENNTMKVYSNSNYGFSAMQLSLNGDINFFAKAGSVVANQIVNLPQNNVFKITGSGFVGIGNTNPLGYLHVNPIRPVIIKNNGSQGVYGSEIGFNAILNTSESPNKFKKLGGTSQQGGAVMVVDYYGNMNFQMYDGLTESEKIINYTPQVTFSNKGYLGIGVVNPLTSFQVNQNRPVLIKNNGNNGVHGSEIGFNAMINTDVTPNKFLKLGGTLQKGGAAIVVDYHGNMLFQTYAGVSESASEVNYNPQIAFTNEGNVGIGTISPDAKLAVKGTIHSQEVTVDLNGSVAPDYVFEDTYKLPTLTEVETYIKENKHLPEVPSAKQMEAEGLKLMEMNLLLLKKVEELTLYVIELKRENEAMKQEVGKLKESLQISDK